MSSDRRTSIVKVMAIILAVLMLGSVISGLFFALAAGL